MTGGNQRLVSSAAILVAFSVAWVKATGPWCFVCSDTVLPSICPYVAQCGPHESCNTQKIIGHNNGEFFTTTCKDTQTCHAKRRSTSRVTVCDDCCSGTLCNEAGCNATAVRPQGRLYCLNCDLTRNPAYCDKVKLCSADEYCSVSLEVQYSVAFPIYKLGCRPKNSCPPRTATMAKDKGICCDSDLCNSNTLGQSPSLYKPTPIPTTRKPAPPQANFDTPLLLYNVTHAPNETLQLLCHVTGWPVPTVHWTYDNGTSKVQIVQGVTVEANGDSLLSIPNPQKSHGGKYTCNATNSFDSDDSTIEVKVLDPPEVSGKLNNSLVLQYQEDRTLDCNVTVGNNGSTNVTWIVPNGVKSYTVHANNSITIHNAHSENAGAYVCVAENEDGKTVKFFSIDVNDTSSQASAQPCTCPTVTTPSCPTVTQSCTCPKASCPTVSPTPCPTVQSTPCTPQTTMSTTLTGQSTSPLTSTSSTTPTTTSTSSTTPTTTSTSSKTPTTTSLTSTTPTTTSTTSTTPTTSSPRPNINTLPTANSQPMSPFSSQPPSQYQVNDQFQSEKRYTNIMHCPAKSPNQGDITWHRKVQDFDHGNPIYTDNGFGILTISNQHTVFTTGVYECRLKNTPIAQFVVYEGLSANVNCNDPFGKISNTVGVVIRAKCGNCPNTVGATNLGTTLKHSDSICSSAIANRLIPAYGGEVTYLIKSASEVVLLDETNGAILLP